MHPQLIALRERAAARPTRRHQVQLTYITRAGRWYHVSWKGHEERSGGIVTNIGIHFFDLLVWLFGPVQKSEVHLREPQRAAGALELERADVHVVPVDRQPPTCRSRRSRARRRRYRSITVDGEEIEFSEGFADLHTRVYEEVLAGRGFGIDEARPSVELTASIRDDRVVAPRTAARIRRLVGAWLTSSCTSRRTSTTAAASARARRSGISPTS